MVLVYEGIHEGHEDHEETRREFSFSSRFLAAFVPFVDALFLRHDPRFA